MRCRYCGSSLDENDEICPVCARPVKGEPVPEQPPVVSPAAVSNEVRNAFNGIAIASLVLGIVSALCCGMFTAPTGIILGFFGLKSNNKGMAIVGLILSIAALVFYVVAFLFVFIGLIQSGAYNEIIDSYNIYR